MKSVLFAIILEFVRLSIAKSVCAHQHRRLSCRKRDQIFWDEHF